jgi:O-methyltransferase
MSKFLLMLKSLLLCSLRRDSYSRYLAVEHFSQWIYPEFKLSEHGRIFFKDDNFLKHYGPIAHLDSTRVFDRGFVLDQLLYLCRNIAGATVECGVYQGAASFLMCNRADRGQKKHYVFDSFEGLSKPLSYDGSYWKDGDMSVPIEKVREALQNFNFIHFFKGWIPHRFSEVDGEKFSFVHVDVDLFQPTFDSIQFFYPRMEVGGILLFDDYGFNTCPGAKLAIDTFMENKPEPVIHLPTGQAFVVKM